jgi:hypothetical protein
MENRVVFGSFLLAVCILSFAAFPQSQKSPKFSGTVKKRVEKQARWVVSESLQKQVAQRSKAFGGLIAFEQCHVLNTRILSGEDMILHGPFFAVDGAPLKSVVIQHQATWMVAVAPSEPGGKMPDPNLLELTEEDWTLAYRERSGNTRVRATGKY